MSEFQEFESISLANELMIPTEEREVPKDPEPPKEETPPPPAGDSPTPEDKGSDKVSINEVISPDDSAQYLVDGIDSIIGIVGTAVYGIKGMRLLTPEQKKTVSAARKKAKEDLTSEEKALLDYYQHAKEKLDDKIENLDLTEAEQIKLKKASKGMIKVKGWKIGPDFAFWIVLADILSDRAIDMFVD